MTSCIIERLNNIYFKFFNGLCFKKGGGIPSLSLGKVGGKLTIIAGEPDWYGPKASCIVMYVYGIRVAMPAIAFNEVGLTAVGDDVTAEMFQVLKNNNFA